MQHWKKQNSSYISLKFLFSFETPTVALYTGDNAAEGEILTKLLWSLYEAKINP